MKRIKILGFYTEPTNGELERCEDDAYLLAPDVAVIEERVGHTFYFVKVEPSNEPGFYTETGPLCDVVIMNECRFADIAAMPEGAALAFALWAAGVDSAIAV